MNLTVVNSLPESIIMFPVENIAGELDIAFGHDCRKRYFVLFALKNMATHCK